MFKKNPLLSWLICTSLLVALTTGCGDDPEDNQNQNQNQNVGDADGDGEPGDGDSEPGDGDSEPGDGDGDVFFVLPAQATVYANSTVTFEVGTTDGVEDVSLVIDETDTLAELESSLTYTWDPAATDYDEGLYEIGIHYTLAGEELIHDGTRTIIVDRTAPELVHTSPEDGSENVWPAAPLVLHFTETLDPESLTTDTLNLAIGDQDVDYTIHLEDGMIVILELDQTQATTPYEATLTIDGVTDLAGNEVESTTISWSARTWVEESFVDNDDYTLSLVNIVEVDRQDYLIARNTTGGVAATIKVFKLGIGEWTEVASSGGYAEGIWALDTAVVGDDIIIAFSPREGSHTRARLAIFDSTDDSFEALVGFSANGAADPAGLSISVAADADKTLIVGVANGEIRVRELVGTEFANSASTLAIDAYERIRPGATAHIGADGTLEIVFAQCDDTEFCDQVSLRHITKSAEETEWTLEDGLFETSAGDGSCDKFFGFSAFMQDGDPIAVMTKQHSCTDGEPRAIARRGMGFETPVLDLTNLLEELPGATADDKYYPTIAPNNNGYDVVLSSAHSIDLMRIDEDNNLIWMNRVDTGMTTGDTLSTQYSHQYFAHTAVGRVVFFRFGATHHIFRLPVQ